MNIFVIEWGVFMYASVKSVGLFGLNGYMVDVEADSSMGLPAFDIVGLPDAAVSESRNRVRSAIKNSGYEFPISRITVNLAPADIRKSGPLYDLPILIAILLASRQLKNFPGDRAFAGELSLDGDVRPVNGILSMALAARSEGFKKLYVPVENASEAAVVKDIEVYGVSSVKNLVAILDGEENPTPVEAMPFVDSPADERYDFADVKGQPAARRAAEIAAAGGHNILMIGPPGSGKSMIAKRIPSILPPLSYQESVETTQIYSAAGMMGQRDSLISSRPFRSPHHTMSSRALTGGGSFPRPGEISLAHNGVLFLDELPEFSRETMEVMRQPLEDGVVSISRVFGTVSYPCNVILVAAMNPCRCGNFGSTVKKCTCTPGDVERYLGKISGPLLDRIDLHVEVSEVKYNELTDTHRAEDSASIRERVIAAREVQSTRYSDYDFSTNADIPASRINEFCVLTEGAENILSRAFESLGLSARAHDKVLRVSRTIADLSGDDIIDVPHVAEAVRYRTLDKKYWHR